MDLDLTKLLVEVALQARQIGIPVPETLCDTVRVNTRATTRLGACVKKDGRFIVEISARLLKAPVETVMETLAHEVLHACPGCQNHGACWKLYAQRMNEAYGYHISRLAAFEGDQVNKAVPSPYLLQCTQCGAQFPRSRCSALVQNPSKYRCRCGGALKRVR